MLQQLERLQKDSSELEIYALKLKKRGKLEKMSKILRNLLTLACVFNTFLAFIALSK